MIIDLAVEYDSERAVLVEDRLAAAGHVNDAESPHAECAAGGYEVPVGIWPAVEDCVAHLSNGDVSRLQAKRETCEPSDATHG
jgi:hypothetical protein